MENKEDSNDEQKSFDDVIDGIDSPNLTISVG